AERAIDTVKRITTSIARTEVNSTCIERRSSQNAFGHVEAPAYRPVLRIETKDATRRMSGTGIEPAIPTTKEDAVTIDRWRSPHRQIGWLKPEHLPRLRVKTQRLRRLPRSADTAAEVQPAGDDRWTGVNVQQFLEMPLRRSS